MCKKDLPAPAGGEAKEQAGRAARIAAGRERPAAAFRRPGCVSLYAGWTFLSGILGIFFALYLPTFLANNSSILLDPANYPVGVEPIDPEFFSFLRTFLAGYSIFIFLAGVVTFLVGWGLWSMRNWARIFILVTQGISLAGGIAGLFMSIASTGGNLLICGAYLVSLIFPGVVFLWFFLNRRLFR
jgi:hypothetical protein